MLYDIIDKSLHTLNAMCGRDPELLKKYVYVFVIEFKKKKILKYLLKRFE